jgi:hypothetical protein
MITVEYKRSKGQGFLLAVNLVIMTAVFVGNYFFLTIGGLGIKAVTSAGFVLMGLLNLAFALIRGQSRISFQISLSAGLLLACLGDILITPSFVIGASLFAAGHICFFVSYCTLDRLRLLDSVIGGGIFTAAACFILFSPILYFSADYLRGICLAYALIISCMAGKAAGNFIRTRNPLTATLLVGCVLFLFSDLMLLLDWFGGGGRVTGLLCMGTYYPAECLLAFSGLVGCFPGRRGYCSLSVGDR